MTLGPQPKYVRRTAGLQAAWGQSVSVAAGAALPRTELVRASVGYPVAWSFAVFFDGGATGALAAPLNVHIQPGMGRGGWTHGDLQTVKVGSAGSLVAPPCGTPATELIIVVETAEVAALPYTLCAVASPIFWVPEWGAQG